MGNSCVEYDQVTFENLTSIKLAYTPPPCITFLLVAHRGYRGEGGHIERDTMKNNDKLLKAIEYVEANVQVTQQLSIVLAAVRALTCDECCGRGRVLIAVADTYVSCDKCREYRKLFS